MAKAALNKTIGNQGESWLAEYLVKQGYKVVDRNWHSRWGEIDVIALKDQELAFVEVKTRKNYSLDRGGLLAINHRKQQKMIMTAQAFLAVNPQWSNYGCRFDVALVQYKEELDSYSFNLRSYLKAAFAS